MRITKDFLTVNTDRERETVRLLRSAAILMELFVLSYVIWAVYTGISVIVGWFV